MLAAYLLCVSTGIGVYAQGHFPGNYYSVLPGFSGDHSSYSQYDRVFADMDGDGVLDVVTANNDSTGTVSVVFGRGDGGFKPAYPLLATQYASAVAVGDFNGDGKPDIVVFNNNYYNSTTVRTLSTFFNKGQGKFNAKVVQSITPFYQYLVAADLHRDGKDDLIAFGNGQMTTLLSNGDGTFTIKDTRTITNGGGGIIVADIDGDGNPDVLNWDSNYYPVSSSFKAVRVFYGVGDGRLDAKRDFATLNVPNAVQVADVNGDGKLDLIVGTASDMEILRNAGGNRFLPPDVYAMKSSIGALAIADFDGDGKSDIAAAGSSSFTQILLNKGDGTYRSGTAYMAGASSKGLAATDVNGDGIIDLVFQSGSGLTTYLGDGRGAFKAPLVAPWSSVSAVADFTGDRKPDVLSITTVLSVYPGVGDGTFGDPIVTPVSGGIKYSAIGDFNGDGKLDVAALSVNNNTVSVSIYTGNASGAFTLFSTYTAPNVTDALALGAGDFNGDGKTDLFLVAGVPYVAFTGTNVFQFGLTASYDVILSDNAGHFTALPSQGIGSGIFSSSVAVGDFNGDGKADIATFGIGVNISNLYGRYDAWNAAVSKGDGTFTFVASGYDDVPNTSQGYHFGSASFTFGDFDGDGKPDLVINRAAVMGGTSITIRHSKPTVADFLIGSAYAATPTGDFDGDGKTDLIVGSAGSYVLYVGNGDGTVSASESFATPIYTDFAADVNGDGRLDIVGSNGVLLNMGSMPVADVNETLVLQGIAANAPAPLIHFALRDNSGKTILTRNVFVGADGAFTLYGVPAGDYTVHIKGGTYLAANVALHVDANNTPVLNGTLRAGDANNDNKIDIADFGVLVSAYNGDVTMAGSGYDVHADFNGDGVIDIADFGLLVSNYNGVGDN